MSEEKTVTTENAEDQGALFFSFHNDERVLLIIKELEEEAVALQNKLDGKDLDVPVLQRHSIRHECHLLSGEKIYDVHYKFTDSETEVEKVHLTPALTPEQAEAILEDHLMREGEMKSPIVTVIEDYGLQPISWCTEYTSKQLNDIKAKREVLKQRQGTFVKREV